MSHVTRRQVLMASSLGGIGLLGFSPATARASNFPKLDKAIAEMKEAQKFLENAGNRFGGHKKKAIAGLKTAISELEEAIKFAESK